MALRRRRHTAGRAQWPHRRRAAAAEAAGRSCPVASGCASNSIDRHLRTGTGQGHGRQCQRLADALAVVGGNCGDGGSGSTSLRGKAAPAPCCAGQYRAADADGAAARRQRILQWKMCSSTSAFIRPTTALAVCIAAIDARRLGRRCSSRALPHAVGRLRWRRTQGGPYGGEGIFGSRDDLRREPVDSKAQAAWIGGRAEGSRWACPPSRLPRRPALTPARLGVAGSPSTKPEEAFMSRILGELVTPLPPEVQERGGGLVVGKPHRWRQHAAASSPSTVTQSDLISLTLSSRDVPCQGPEPRRVPQRRPRRFSQSPWWWLRGWPHWAGPGCSAPRSPRSAVRLAVGLSKSSESSVSLGISCMPGGRGSLRRTRRGGPRGGAHRRTRGGKSAQLR